MLGLGTGKKRNYLQDIICQNELAKIDEWKIILLIKVQASY